MNANDAEICRVGNLEADILTSSAYSISLKFSQYYCETSMTEIQQRKVKNIFFDKKKKKKKNHFTIEIA